MNFYHLLLPLVSLCAMTWNPLPAREVRQTIGERAAPARPDGKPRHQREERQQIGERAPQLVRTPNQERPQMGERATPQGVCLPAQERQRIGERASTPASTILIPHVPQRTERPTPQIAFVAPAIVRPISQPRALPYSVTIEQRSAAYPYATLTPVKITRKGNEIQLDNGSAWRVRHRDHRLAKKWKAGDAILIETSQCFSWSTYKLVNYSRKETVDVELIEPVHSGTLAQYVAEIQPFEGFLRLQDGSIWRMSTQELLKWRVGDDVIVALSKNWFSSDSSYVLINPRVKTRLMAIFSISL